MTRGLLTRTGLTATMAVAGGLIGLFGAHTYNGRPGQFSARATLAMLPGPEVQVAETPAFWEVLNSGQATRTAATVIGDSRWLVAAASAAGVPSSTLTLAAGAIPQTTLITVTVNGSSGAAARAALDSVLTDSAGFAARVSGPFELQTVAPPAARSLRPSDSQVLAALIGGGVLLGAGAGALLGRFLRRRARPAEAAAVADYASAGNPEWQSAER